MATMAQIAGEVAREWAAEGRMAVPPAVDAPEDDTAFWDEVARRAATPVDEAFNVNQPRYPRGHPKAGQWRPGLSAGAGRIAPGHLTRDLAALKDRVGALDALYTHGPPTHTVKDVGLDVEKVALRYSARRHYEKRLKDIRAERTAIQDRKWAEWEKASPLLTPDEWANANPEDYLTKAQTKRLRAIQDEEIRLTRERDRADRDAMLAVLREIRPMGGKLNEAKDFAVERQSGILEDYAKKNPDIPQGAIRAKVKSDLDEAVKEVVKVVPKAWLDDVNRKGQVSWLFSKDRAYASTSTTEPKRPDDGFREMEDAVDLALKGKLTHDLIQQAGDPDDPWPKAEAGPDARADWLARRAEKWKTLEGQKYKWVGRAGSPGNPSYPKGLWAVIEGEQDKQRYYVDWGGNLHHMREPRESDSAQTKMNMSMPIQEGKREDRRVKGVWPITRLQQQGIERAIQNGGSYEGMYDNRWPVIRRAGTEEGGIGPYAAIYDWIDDNGSQYNLEVDSVAPRTGGTTSKRAFLPERWDRKAPRPPQLPSTTDTIIKIDPRSRNTLLHELSHRLELVYGEENRAGYHPIAATTHAWREGRTQGEAAQKLSDLYPGYAYEDHEYAKPDKFVDGYIGKQYGSEVSEVLTMGMEMLWFPRYGERDINKDPEMRRLILGMLAAL